MFDNLHGWGAKSVLWTGTFFILAAAVLAILVVVPRLRSRKTLEIEAGRNFIYFGHLQFWNPADLEDALKQQEILPILSHQLVNMSKIAWRKHRFVQLSFVLAAVGGVFVFIAGIAT
ncbi:Pycsar system effector family protein [Streptomyces anandii]|uniref:Pycsar system effector family protein n=1 Tax=Streptomyces anandii TaxID=285454 RepID=UPI000AA23ECD|nr:Pycsar system effector family protein [Streptomyces anandii]